MIMKKSFIAVAMVSFYVISFFFGVSLNVKGEDAILIIDAPVSVDEESSFIVTIRSNGTVIENASVTFNKVTRYSNMFGQVVFTAPSVLLDAIYEINTIADNYDEVSIDITITNIHKLSIIVNCSESQSNDARYDINVWVTDENGQLIPGALVFLDNQSQITFEGRVFFTVSPVKLTEYTISATKPGFKSAEPVALILYPRHKQPGFEFILLISAIVLAFIIRKKIY